LSEPPLGDPLWDEPLPDRYHDDRITLIARDPYWLYTYWELTPMNWARARGILGGRARRLAQQPRALGGVGRRAQPLLGLLRTLGELGLVRPQRIDPLGPGEIRRWRRALDRPGSGAFGARLASASWPGRFGVEALGHGEAPLP